MFASESQDCYYLTDVVFLQGLLDADLCCRQVDFCLYGRLCQAVCARGSAVPYLKESFDLTGAPGWRFILSTGLGRWAFSAKVLLLGSVVPAIFGCADGSFKERIVARLQLQSLLPQ